MKTNRWVVLSLLLALGLASGIAAAGTETITAAEAKKHVGEYATVCGQVVSATYASSSRGRPTFLNLDKPYPDHIFTVVIWGSDRAAFGEPEIKYADQRVCVTGTIETYRGKPQINPKRPSQVALQGD